MSIQSFFSSPHTQAVKNDVRNLAQDTLTVAQKHVVEPATVAMRQAVSTASNTAKGALANARTMVSQQASQAERVAAAQWDRTSNWITANPFTTLGIAFAAGLTFSAFSSFVASRR